jgi:hypothetical protein
MILDETVTRSSSVACPATDRIVAARIELLRKTGGQLVALAAAAAIILDDQANSTTL